MHWSCQAGPGRFGTGRPVRAMTAPRRFNEANSTGCFGSYFGGVVVEREASGNNSANIRTLAWKHICIHCWFYIYIQNPSFPDVLLGDKWKAFKISI